MLSLERYHTMSTFRCGVPLVTNLGLVHWPHTAPTVHWVNPAARQVAAPSPCSTVNRMRGCDRQA